MKSYRPESLSGSKTSSRQEEEAPRGRKYRPKAKHKERSGTSSPSHWPGQPSGANEQEELSPQVLKRRRLAALNRGKPDHHRQQFVKAARRSIDLWLSGSAWDVMVDCVTLQPGGTVLEVVVAVPGLTMDQVRERESQLRHLEGPLRDAVASEINRRRTPHIRIRVVPMPAMA